VAEVDFDSLKSALRYFREAAPKHTIEDDVVFSIAGRILSEADKAISRRKCWLAEGDLRSCAARLSLLIRESPWNWYCETAFWPKNQTKFVDGRQTLPYGIVEGLPVIRQVTPPYW